MNDYRLFHDAFRASLSTNGDYLMHYGRRGMRWGKSIYQDDYVPKGKEASGDEDGNQWWEDAYNTARNAYNSAKQGIQNFGNEAARQAHHARGYASVAGHQARVGMQNLGDRAERVGRRAGRTLHNIRRDVEEGVNNARQSLHRTGENIKNDALIGYANHLARKYDEPYVVERQGHTYRSQYTGDPRRISREDFNNGRRRPRKAYKRRSL
jgi:hypothetical protein